MGPGAFDWTQASRPTAVFRNVSGLFAYARDAMIARYAFAAVQHRPRAGGLARPRLRFEEVTSQQDTRLGMHSGYRKHAWLVAP